MPKDTSPPATDKPKVGRPPNSWILFRSDMHKQLKAAGNVKMTQATVSKYIADLWARATPEVRAHWDRVAESAKMDHMARNPGYKFAPKKKEEKEREREQKRLEKEARAARKNARTTTSYIAPPDPMNPASYYPNPMAYGPHGPSPPASAAASPAPSEPQLEFGGESSEAQTPASYDNSFPSYQQPVPDQPVAGPSNWQDNSIQSPDNSHGLQLPAQPWTLGGSQEPTGEYMLQYDVHQPWNAPSEWNTAIDDILSTNDPSVFRLGESNPFDGNSLDISMGNGLLSNWDFSMLNSNGMFQSNPTPQGMINNGSFSFDSGAAEMQQNGSNVMTSDPASLSLSQGYSADVTSPTDFSQYLNLDQLSVPTSTPVSDSPAFPSDTSFSQLGASTSASSSTPYVPPSGAVYANNRRVGGTWTQYQDPLSRSSSLSMPIAP